MCYIPPNKFPKSPPKVPKKSQRFPQEFPKKSRRCPQEVRIKYSRIAQEVLRKRPGSTHGTSKENTTDSIFFAREIETFNKKKFHNFRDMQIWENLE